MTTFIAENVSFLIGTPVIPVLRRDLIRAPVPPVVATGTTVVTFVPPDEKVGAVPRDPKPAVVR